MSGKAEVRELALSNGKVALVDDADYMRAVAAGPWHDRHGYAVRNVSRPGQNQTGCPLQRYLLDLRQDDPRVDFANGNKLDCRRENLRLATRTQINCNRRISRKNSSGVKGVSWHKHLGRWHARIMVSARSISVGYFDDLQEAANAIQRARELMHGDFACHGQRGGER